MTKDEFVTRVQELLHEFVMTDKEKYTVFVAIYETQSTDVSTFGYGCPACVIEALTEDLDVGNIRHLDDGKQEKKKEGKVIH